MTIAAPTPDQVTQPPSARSGAGRIILGLALSVLSAVMLYVMWDGFGNLWPLVFVGFVPMYVAQYRLLPRKLSGVAVGIAATGYWLAMWMNGGAILGLGIVIGAAVIMGVIWFVIGVFERPFSERTNYKWFLIQLPVLWVGLEVIFQANLLIGSNYWIAYRAASAPWLIQPVSVLSSPALSFVMVLVNAAIALLVLKAMDRKWPQLATVAIPGRVVKWTTVIAAIVVVVWVGSSLFIYSQVTSQLGKSVKVAAVQPGTQYTSVADGGSLGAALPETPTAAAARNVKLQAQLTAMTKSAATQGAQLVVWPEWLLTYDASGPMGAWIGPLAKETNTTIVAGYVPDYLSAATPNIAGTWLPTGQMAGEPYYKIHPVIAEGEAFKTPVQYPTYKTPFGQLGVMICFDHDFPNSTARIETLSGADIFAVPALDPASIVNLRWQSVVFRAVENRVPMVKADIGWDSVIVNADGNVQDRMAVANSEGQTALLVANVNVGPRGSPFTAAGGYTFATLIILGLLGRYICQMYLRRRRGKA